MLTYAYSLAAVDLTISGVLIRGFRKSDSITINPRGAQIEVDTEGIDNPIAYPTLEKAFDVTINVSHVSPGHRDLATLLQNQLTILGIRPGTTFAVVGGIMPLMSFQLIDRATGDTFVEEAAILAGYPESAYASTPGSRSYSIVLPSPVVTLGTTILG